MSGRPEERFSLAPRERPTPRDVAYRYSRTIITSASSPMIPSGAMLARLLAASMIRCNASVPPDTRGNSLRLIYETRTPHPTRGATSPANEEDVLSVEQVALVVFSRYADGRESDTRAPPYVARRVCCARLYVSLAHHLRGKKGTVV